MEYCAKHHKRYERNVSICIGCHAEALSNAASNSASKSNGKSNGFDKRAYQREYMRKRREAAH